MKVLVKTIFAASLFTLSLLPLSSVALFAQTADREVTLINQSPEFKEIDAKELPEAVQKAIAEKYPYSEIQKASVNADELYKIELNVGAILCEVLVARNGSIQETEAEVQPETQQTEEVKQDTEEDKQENVEELQENEPEKTQPEKTQDDVAEDTQDNTQEQV
ncbi:MAG: hypothetical protein RR202_10795 [Bacteroidales bacterium]